MDVKIEKVTPAKAEAWLNVNKNNRKMRDGTAEKYAEDMKHGRWTQCPMPISFYEDGDLADGQHRLWAIIESNKTIEFVIARGLTREDGLNIDTGLGRSIVDNARISGTDTDLSNELVSIARAVATGQPSQGAKPLSNAQRLEYVDEHREACKWAVAHGPHGRGLRNAMVMAAIARAWYWEQDKDKLERFADVFSTGFMDGDGESAAVTLRNYFMTKKGLGTSALWRDTFVKAQNAIEYFMKGKKLTVIKAVQDEAYPLKRKRK